MKDNLENKTIIPQKILVFQENGSGESKIAGIRKYGNNLFAIDTFSIDVRLPDIIDNSGEYLPENMEADLVLDYLKHPDLSLDLAKICSRKNITAVASGKKYKIKNVYTPPT